MGARTASLVVVALLVAGCGSGEDAAIEASDAPTTSVPTASPASSLPPSTRPSPTATYQAPSINVDCPDDFSYPWGSSATVDFGYRWSPGTEPVVSWSMLYGDGNTYTSETAEDADANLFWHVYDKPGTYQATATIADTVSSQAASATCSFTYSWTGSAPPPSTGGGNGGIGDGYGAGGSSSGWLGCHYNGIPMWGDVKVVDFAPDVTVKVVDFAADLRVKMVEFGANDCGQWREVDFGADFTITFVDFAADVDIKFVDFGEGR